MIEILRLENEVIPPIIDFQIQRGHVCTRDQFPYIVVAVVVRSKSGGCVNGEARGCDNILAR